MITPAEIKKKAENKYCAYLQSVVEGTAFNPIVIAGDKKPSDNTALFEQELRNLIDCSKEKNRYGYTMEYQTVKTKRHGTQDIPTLISFQTEADYLRFIGKQYEAEQFRKDVSMILSLFPELKEWIYKHPTKVIGSDWNSLLKVCRYFKDTPKPHLYIRELPIQVHTKFVERNKGIIRELLDILISDALNTEEKDFEKRFNLKYVEPLVRFRILDDSISRNYCNGISDLSVTISQFRKMALPIQIIYIVENKMNMLTFPPVKESIVIWGHGFGVDVMKNVEWMKSMHIYYWGDLDAQGFQILSEIRTYYQQVVSFLMDRETFDRYSEGDIGTESNITKDLCLTTEENEMFKYLRDTNLRLEQEKIPFDYAVANIPI